MKFKEWLKIDEARYKGLKRQFFLNNPQVPNYITNQIYSNHISRNMNQALKKYQNDTVTNSDNSPLDATIIQNSQSPLPSNISYNNNFWNNIQWGKPRIIQLSPLNLDAGTLQTFEQWRFGYSPKDKLVRNDAQRFDVQREKLVNQSDGNNEPIILIKIGDKYKLIEGFHRTMIHLISAHNPEIGAPPDQIEIIKNHDVPLRINYSKWKPVLIKAYVGIRT